MPSTVVAEIVTAMGRSHRPMPWTEVDRLGVGHDGVVSRALLRGGGVDSDRVRNQLRAGRWATHGRQTVALHTGELTARARQWRAVWEVGALIAVLDGVLALQAAGLTGYDEPDLHVSTLHRHHGAAADGVRVHAIGRRLADETVAVGVPRTRPHVAAVRAAHWAVSDRQAALVLVMPVQQRLTTGDRLVEAADLVPGRNRRALVRQLVQHIADGAQSLGELDFAGLCRRRGLPEPSRQVVVRGPGGWVYLDVRWDGWGLVVEIDGSGHRHGLAVTDDNLRANAVSLATDLVLRIDLLGLRLAAEAFMDQVAAGLALRRAA